MKREEILQRLRFTVPEKKRKRVIVHTDICNEADDPFAIMHHLLTPSEEVEGIIAGHNEWVMGVLLPMVAKQRGMSPEEFERAMMQQDEEKQSMTTPRCQSMEKSYQEGLKILKLAEIDDVPMLRGSVIELQSDKAEDLPESEGADFIIQQARKEDDRPLYVALQGCLTDLAIAYLKEPSIADKVIAIWIGGGKYPEGGDEFNLKQDILAARVLFNSPMEIWQIPVNVYVTMEFSLSELVDKIAPCGEIGAYLCDEMLTFNEKMGMTPGDFPHGEIWSIGDNPTVSVLLQNSALPCYHMEHAPYINDDYTYTPRADSKLIRVYDSVDARLTLSDLFSKLRLCYGTAARRVE
ncbi:MAG: nucleoside hydrolase [Ruminococcus flavefaciens]|nr:nucleoside hydrolase [Ruminococcus flavefaciens]